MTDRRLFVSGIANNVPEETVRGYFSQFGAISEFTLPVERETGMNRGYAYITFLDDTSNTRCMEESIHKINGRDVTITRLSDEDAITSMESLKSHKLFVSFLGVESVTEDSLRQAFSMYGSISSVNFARDEDGGLLYYAIIKFDKEDAVDMCLQRNHCINGRSIVVRKAVTKEQFKLAEQAERERAHLQEHQKHGYAGYTNTRLVAVPVRPQQPTISPQVQAYQAHSATTQVSLSHEQYRLEYERYQLQMAEYQRQLAEYHVKLNKYNEEMQQYQKQRQYSNALDQAAFHKAYNYNTANQGEPHSSSFRFFLSVMTHSFMGSL
ncbi:unnamed protein product [Nippostrongylus brasiliensis]|uniref:Putative RNA-binding protein (inferred by orthology to a C. elegans protein) n=1 Tax=Nippostrongylus brasiliensis TaxID=27835 RepID=A0A0N4XF81_NIPBR|nr:unnamed protein product [Nippostrongylus brasiliensis]